nr:hypothetical protein [Morchella crassipes]
MVRPNPPPHRPPLGPLPHANPPTKVGVMQEGGSGGGRRGGRGGCHTSFSQLSPPLSSPPPPRGPYPFLGDPLWGGSPWEPSHLWWEGGGLGGGGGGHFIIKMTLPPPPFGHPSPHGPSGQERGEV